MLEIREARVEDVPAILHIYNRAIMTTTATFDLEEQTLEQRQEWFSHYGGVHPIIVAEQSGNVIGYSCLSQFRPKRAYDRTVELSIYIDESYWGQGIGKKLMAEILKRAADAGHHVVIAAITAGNDVSVKMHEKFGFSYCGCLKEVGFKFDTWQDVFYYQLTLR